jgi:hypothetical protein
MNCDEYRYHYRDYSKLPLAAEIANSLEWLTWMEHFHSCTVCFDWTLEQRIKERGADPKDFPCIHLANQITYKCDIHPDPADCPDILISYFARFDEYSIAVKGGGTSAVAIRFCPWCGIALPESKRDRWFDELHELGYDSPGVQEIPPQYWTDAWFKE